MSVYFPLSTPLVNISIALALSIGGLNSEAKIKELNSPSRT